MARGGSRGKREVALDEVDEPAVLTFFFSDVEGSTQLAEQLGTQTFARVLEAHRALVRDAFEQHGGHEISTGGDSFFAVFASVTDAVAAAVDVQRRLAVPLESGVRLRVRIGLHSGHAVRVADDYLGLDVNRAARVADAGHGGQIVVSDAVRGALGGTDDGLTLRDLGRHRLKDVGAERLWQVEADGLTAGPFPPPRSLEAHPSNLPTATTEFVGRQAEMSQLAGLLATNPVVTVTGAGGIGKSRLAIETARSAIQRFADGVFYVDVSTVPSADAAAVALVDVLALAGTSDDAVESLQKRLRDRDLLILLDTADRVAGISALIASLAAACPQVRLLVTSRSPLHVAAERVLALGPLAVTDAVRLFEERAQAARPQWRADESTLRAVEALVDRLDAIPLAIELAAARTRILTPTAILDRLERQLPALADAPADMPDRQRTLHATIAWSFDQLDPDEQRLFARLGVFVAAFGLDAVDGVAAEADVDSLAVLERLVDRSLVGTDESSGAPAFRLLAPIREFAGQVLRASGEEDAVRERHARYHLGLLRRLADALESPDDLAAVGAIESSEPDLRATLEWALDHAGTGIALEVAGRLGRYWWLRGRVREGVDWLERALSSDVARDPAVERRTLATALYWAGVLLDDARRPDEARHRLESALDLQREAGDERAIARTLNSLGVVARSQGELERADELFAESLERKRRLGDQSGIAVTLSNLGVVAADRRDFERAADLLAQALVVDEATRSTSAMAVSCANLGSVLILAGRPAEGSSQIRRALPAVAELRDPELVAGVLTSLSHIRLSAPDANGATDAARMTLVAEELRRREGIPLRPVEQEEVDDLLNRELEVLGAERIAAIRIEATVTDLDASLRLAEVAAKLAV